MRAVFICRVQGALSLNKITLCLGGVPADPVFRRNGAQHVGWRAGDEAHLARRPGNQFATRVLCPSQLLARLFATARSLKISASKCLENVEVLCFSEKPGNNRRTESNEVEKRLSQ